MSRTLREHIAITRFDAYKERVKNLKPLSKQVQDEATTLTEELPYFELAGYKLEKQNHGTPQCPDIKINEKNASRIEPQAWSKEIDGATHWFYNFLWAVAEAIYLGKKAPTIDEWMKMLASVNGSVEEKAKALGIPLSGFHDAKDGTFREEGDRAYLWSSPEDVLGNDAPYVFLPRGGSDHCGLWDNRGRGMSVRWFFG
jgi:hypothetical protein